MGGAQRGPWGAWRWWGAPLRPMAPQGCAERGSSRSGRCGSSSARAKTHHVRVCERRGWRDAGLAVTQPGRGAVPGVPHPDGGCHKQQLLGCGSDGFSIGSQPGVGSLESRGDAPWAAAEPHLGSAGTGGEARSPRCPFLPQPADVHRPAEVFHPVHNVCRRILTQVSLPSRSCAGLSVAGAGYN